MYVRIYVYMLEFKYVCQNVNMKRNVNMNWNLGMYVGIYVWICAGMYVRMGIGNTVCWVGLGMWYFWYYCGWEALVDLECLCELICVLRHWWWFLISTFWFLISHNHDFWFWLDWIKDWMIYIVFVLLGECFFYYSSSELFSDEGLCVIDC